MEPILFYGVPQGCSFGSIVALEWLGQPYRLCRINMPGDMQNDLYSRLNPRRETPVLLLENGEPLTESAAILQNIAGRDPARGLGFAQGDVRFDHLNQMIAFLNTTYFSAYNPLWKAYEMEENPPVQAVLRNIGREAVEKAHEQLEAMVPEGSCLAGTERTIADAYLTGIARWAVYHRVIEPRAYPKLHRLLQKLEADPAVIFAHAIEEGSTAITTGAFRGHVSLASIGTRLSAPAIPRQPS